LATAPCATEPARRADDRSKPGFLQHPILKANLNKRNAESSSGLSY
ncbi:hypothetical protein A2U01_0113593, partial [Trifolium medium]|nr:hypothetical protein [Trifolium medium]